MTPTSFTEVAFRQWHSFPSSLPGSGLHPAPDQDAIPVLMCLCGNLIRPGRLRQRVPEHLQSLRESFDLAEAYRARCHPQYTVNLLNSEFADTKWHTALLEQIAVLEKIVQEIPKLTATRMETTRKESPSTPKEKLAKPKKP